MHDNHDRIDFQTAAFQRHVPINKLRRAAEDGYVRTVKKADRDSPSGYVLLVVADEMYDEWCAEYHRKREAARPTKTVRTYVSDSPRPADASAPEYLTYKEASAKYGIPTNTLSARKSDGTITAGPPVPNDRGNDYATVADDDLLKALAAKYAPTAGRDASVADVAVEAPDYLTYREVEAKYGVSAKTVQKWKSDGFVTGGPDRREAGKRSQATVLDDEQLVARVEQYEPRGTAPADTTKWVTYSEIADRVGCAYDTVAKWKDGLTTKPGPPNAKNRPTVLVADDEALADRVAAYEERVEADQEEDADSYRQSTRGTANVYPPLTPDAVAAMCRFGALDAKKKANGRWAVLWTPILKRLAEGYAETLPHQRKEPATVKQADYLRKLYPDARDASSAYLTMADASALIHAAKVARRASGDGQTTNEPPVLVEPVAEAVEAPDVFATTAEGLRRAQELFDRADALRAEADDAEKEAHDVFDAAWAESLAVFKPRFVSAAPVPDEATA